MNLLAECKGASRIGISGHIRPDGDCVGSCLALYQYLKKALPQTLVQVYLENPNDIFREIKGFDDILCPGKEQEPFDVYFVLDCSDDRLGGAEEYYQQAKKRINIDHHISNSGCGDVNLVRPEVGSCSEVLFHLFDNELVDQDIAKAVYVGMIHDTGIFQYANTSPETLRTAAQLIEYGFDFPNIIQETFYQKTYLQTQIMGRVLMESVRFMDGRCIVGWVDRRTMEFYDVSSKDFEGIVNQLRNITGVDCAIFMYEMDVQEFKISLRTSEKVDATKVVVPFGGGGHMRAAGCTMKGTFHDCVNNLSRYIEEQLEK
ncbi:MAG: bifunctional oligoribonuclease/PAP phosphatase NrnA [Lachnospiraceae bacterium]|nr:bifunctional oligoribonuclease/PAP phosphatase NrnA [Lachnospiraceae bacterium]